MVNSYLLQLAQVLIATHAAAESGDLSAALAKGGLSKEEVGRGAKLAEQAEHLIREKIDVTGEDRTQEHVMHVATEQVEMWMQTVQFLAKKSIADDSLRELLLATNLHSHDHAATTVARALRMQSMLRCDDRVIEAFGGEEKARHTANRGYALTGKMLSASDIRLRPQGDEVEKPIFKQITSAYNDLRAWTAVAETAAQTVAEKDLRLVGRLGIVPQGVGLPSGGYSLSVLLHQRGQTDIPSRERTDCSGWSIGRQGRNNQNLGKGWLEG